MAAMNNAEKNHSCVTVEDEMMETSDTSSTSFHTAHDSTSPLTPPLTDTTSTSSDVVETCNSDGIPREPEDEVEKETCNSDGIPREPEDEVEKEREDEVEEEREVERGDRTSEVTEGEDMDGVERTDKEYENRKIIAMSNAGLEVEEKEMNAIEQNSTSCEGPSEAEGTSETNGTTGGTTEIGGTESNENNDEIIDKSVQKEIITNMSSGGEGGGDRTPSVVSSGYGGSREVSPDDDVMVGGVITADMKEEEKELKEKGGGGGDIESNEMERLSKMKEYQRYTRLQHLLQKSSIYSKFLLERMENQVTEKKKRGEGKGKKTGGGGGEKEGEKGPRRSTRGKKRKAEEPLELSHYMDNQGKLKQMKLDKGGGVSLAISCTSTNKTSSETETTERTWNGKPIPAAQPHLMTGGIMRTYQLQGMEWIKVLYENGVNGILADEMGLGKTLQVIGVIAHLIEMGVKGPFLVAAPLSTLPNWVSEFNKFTPRIPVILYHGTQGEREKMRRKMFREKRKKTELDTQPVVVTSYEICMRDQRYLMDRKWRFLVVDEGHRIKNLNCKLIRSLKSYDAENRLLLTGTPLQNNLAELWSLLNFILPDIFDDLNGFQSWFDFDVSGEKTREKIIAQEREQNVLSTLHQILTPFLLRRLKSDVEFSLPPKKEVLVYAPLTTVQQKYYSSLLDKTIFDMVKGKKEESTVLSQRQRQKPKDSGYSQLSDEQFEAVLAGETSYSDLIPSDTTDKNKLKLTRNSVTDIKLNSVWMMLRKCCNHPYLLEFPMTSEGKFRIDEDLVRVCGKMLILDRLLPALITRGHKTIIFSQFTTMLDLLEDYLELRDINYGRLDGQMVFSERQRQIIKFQEDPDCKVFLTSTRAGGLGINLTAADTVIIYDSDWNPQADLQAQDRCHRIGQTKPVIVYRIVTANTFDQKIVEKATSKRRLEKMVIHKGRFKGCSGQDQQVSLDDLVSLLHSVDHQTVVDSNDAVISDLALEALLDRSQSDHRRATGKEEEEEEESHESLFKIIHEEDTSSAMLQGINSSTSSDLLPPHSETPPPPPPHSETPPPPPPLPTPSQPLPPSSNVAGVDN